MPPSGKSKKNKMLASYNKVWPANRGPHNRYYLSAKKPSAPYPKGYAAEGLLYLIESIFIREHELARCRPGTALGEMRCEDEAAVFVDGSQTVDEEACNRAGDDG